MGTTTVSVTDPSSMELLKISLSSRTSLPFVVMVHSYNETNEMIRALGSALKEKNLVPENDDSDLKVSDGEHVWIGVLLHPLVPSRWHLLPHSLRVGPRRVQLLLHQQCCCYSL